MEPMDKFDKIFTQIRKKVEQLYPTLVIAYVWCPQCDEEHEKSFRQYAHTWHLNRPKICFAADTVHLSKNYVMGIIWHEVGHLLEGPYGSEEQANQRIMDDFGVEIIYCPRTSIQTIRQKKKRKKKGGKK
jgi:hypothetical protein